MFKRIYIVINPSSGQPEPVLFHLNEVLGDTGITWDVGITKKAGDGFRLTSEALKHTYDCVVAYGGDGTVTEVAQALFKKNVPLLILPGGTMNVLARVLSLPESLPEVLQILKRKKQKISKIDMGESDGKPFLLRIETGLISSIVENTSIEDKTTYGKLAYIVRTPSIVRNTKDSKYTIEVDGKTFTEQGVAMGITNTPDLGIPSSSKLSKISLTDGKLDLAIARTFDIMSFVKSAVNKVINSFPEDHLFHVQGKEITVTVSPPQTTSFDDVIVKPQKKIRASVVPKALSVIMS